MTATRAHYTTIEMYNNKGRVLYFAFGSNLFKERININCPSAKFQCAAKLEDYKLDYFNYSEMWHGAGASIVSSAGAHCYGAVWSISTDEVAALDRLVVHALIIYDILSGRSCVVTLKDTPE